jgi:hypothetical protein
MILDMYFLISPLGDIRVFLFVPNIVIFLIFMKVSMEILSLLFVFFFLAGYLVPCPWQVILFLVPGKLFH